MSSPAATERRNVFEVIDDESMQTSSGASKQTGASNSPVTNEVVVEGCAVVEEEPTAQNSSSKGNSPKKAVSKKKKAKPKRKRRGKMNYDSDSGDGNAKAKQLLKKYSGQKGKVQIGGKNDNKGDTGPFIRISGLGGDGSKARYTVVNSLSADSTSQMTRTGVLEPHFYEMASCDPDMPWLCCFCRRPPYYERLSFLYGPYNISGDCKNYLMDDPFDCFPHEKAYREKKLKEEPDDQGPLSVWFHWECFLFTNGCYFLNKLIGLDDAVSIAVKTKCSHCKRLGATLSCCMKGCTKTFHYVCGRTSGASYNEEYCTIFCYNHRNGTRQKRNNTQ